jgi:hypothetical protein
MTHSGCYAPWTQNVIVRYGFEYDVGRRPREGLGRAHLPTVGRATTLKIANDIITDYLDCKHKAYLSVSNSVGRTSDYEMFLKQQELQYSGGAISVQLGQGDHSDPLHNKPITLADLAKGADVIPNVLLTTESMTIAVHCIKRSPGLSSLGPFHYEPVLFFCLDWVAMNLTDLYLRWPASLLSKCRVFDRNMEL